MSARSRFHLLTCDMLLRAVRQVVAESPHEIVVRDLSAALHGEPRSLRERIQAEIDAVDVADPAPDAVLLGYGLCGGATAGVAARSRPVVLARAHDCVTILLGGRERSRREQEATPGTYWFTEDNVRTGTALTGWLLGDAARTTEVESTRRDFVARYGPDNADYLLATLGQWRRRYERGVYIDSGPADDDDAAAQAQQASQERGWRFERAPADLALLRRLVSGVWDDDFIVVEPGQRLAMSYDDGVLQAG